MAIDIEDERIYDLKQVAALLHTTVLTVRLAVRGGRLSAVKIGREYRVLGSDLAKYLKAQTR